MRTFIVTLTAMAANAVDLSIEAAYNCSYEGDCDGKLARGEACYSTSSMSGCNDRFPEFPNVRFKGDEQFCVKGSTFCHITQGNCGDGATRMHVKYDMYI